MGSTPSAKKNLRMSIYEGRSGLVFGRRGKGIRPGVLQHCDERVRIPMRGQVESLNVSAAAAIVLFEAVRQRKLTKPPSVTYRILIMLALDGRFQQLSRVRHAHFLHHIGAVGFDGFDADFQPLADFLVLKSRPDQFKNFLLATGQGFGRFLRGGGTRSSRDDFDWLLQFVPFYLFSFDGRMIAL